MVGAKSFWLIFLGVNLIVHDKHEGFFKYFQIFLKIIHKNIELVLTNIEIVGKIIKILYLS
jgi:hypothetical protein